VIEIAINNEQKIEVTLTPKSASNKPAVLDGPPTWTVQSGDSTLDVAANGLSSFLVSSDSPGETMILVEADAKIGPDIETISDNIKLTVTGAQAENLGVSVGTAVPK